ncbi:MAG: fused MFS/spermidine synthase [Deltaproteobacteria bacterium]|nr:fused MFS/spermidine synthase [Deltaproteobacteria bacterium]
MVFLLFFLSGFTALLYEVVWQRLLHLTFGLSTYAVTTVTASFMLGLALGYLLGQNRRLVRYHPLVVYGLAEGLIGVFALIFPLLVRLIDTVYVATGGSFFLDIILSFVALAFPATLMGLTLPTLARFVVQGGPAGRRIGLLYALNTTGSVLGAFFAGVFFIRTYGVFTTTLIATTMNAAICLVALTQPRKALPEREGTGLPSAPRVLSLRGFLTFPFITGFIGLALEILWVRTLVCVVSNNTYSFAVVLADVLAGLALGAWLYALVGPSRSTPQTKAFVFLLVEVAAAVFILVSLTSFNHLHAIALNLSHRVGGSHWLGLGLVRLGAAAVVTLIPAMASGFVTPLLVDLLRNLTAQSADSSASVVFAANTLGSMTGALTGGLVLIPLLGLSYGMVFLAVLSITVGLLMFFSLPPVDRTRLVTGCSLVTAALLIVLFAPKELTLTKWYDRFENVQGELLFYREGAFGTVAVFQLGDVKEMTINCIEEVPTHRDAISTFKLLGHLPLLFHDNPKTVLVNAVGGGVTLGAVAKHEVTVDAVDIVPDVRDAMALFAKENGEVLQRTNWRLIADDGRHFLKISPQHYDVITADATHPAAAESWVLYTQEYYQLVKAKLTDQGVFAQWLPLHNMAPADYLSVLRTFRSVFPEALLLFTNRYTLMVGAKAALPLTVEALNQRLARENAAVRADLQEIGVSRGQDILKYIIVDGPGIDKLVAHDYPILTDDQTSVEFAELNRLGIPGTMPFILARLLPEIRPDVLAQRYGVEPRVFLARALLMRSKAVGTDDPLERSFQALQEVDQAARLAPDDGDITYYKQITTLEFLDLLQARYTELFNSSTPQTLLPKAGFAAQLQPQNPFVQELLGVTLLKLKRYEEAVAPLEAAVALKGDDVNYLSNLAFAYDQVQRPADALRVLKQAKTVKPEAAKFLDEAIRRIEQKAGASN